MARRILTSCNSVVHVVVYLPICFLLLAMHSHAQTTPQFALQGEFEAPFEYLNTIPSTGIDIDDDGMVDIERPCRCRSLAPFPSGQTDNNGIFDDQLIIATGISGQQWSLSERDNILDATTLQPIALGAPIPEIGNTGIYVLPFAYNESEPYTAMVFEQAAPTSFYGPVTDQCFYPDPYINEFDEFFCTNADDMLLSALTTSGYQNNTWVIDPVSHQWTIFPQDGGDLINGPYFSPSDMEEGVYTIKYFFYGSEDPFSQTTKTGCLSIVEKDFIVRDGSGLVCNNDINITINPNQCEVIVSPNILLSGDPLSYEGYTVNVAVEGGPLLNDTIPSQYIGQNLTGILSDECAGTYCTVDINLVDLHDPVIGEVTDITLPCTATYVPEDVPIPTVTDCAPVELTYTDDITNNGCDNPKIHIVRTWKAEDSSGNISTKIQNIYIERATQEELRFPQDTIIECDAYLANPAIITPELAGLPNLVNDQNCDFVYTYSDNMLDGCGDNTTSFIIIRTWTVIDQCSSTIYDIDGLGNDNKQVINVRDNTPPTLTTQPLNTIVNISSLENDDEGCTSTALLFAPTVVDECNDYEVRIFTPLGEAVYVNGSNGNNGGHIPAPGLPIGTHDISYQVTDACGNQSTASTTVTIHDETLPNMICNGSLNLTLDAGGQGFITPDNIDEGSRDNCCMGEMLIKQEGQPDSEFSEFLTFFCVNDTITVVLRAIDCHGNYNECSTDIIISDPVPPYVVSSPNDVTLNCQSTYDEYLQADFDAPTFDDNCNYSTSYEVIPQINNCGAGQLLRIWTAQDNPFNPPAKDTQIVVLDLHSDYDIILPADQVSDCVAGAFLPVEFESRGCEMIDINVITDTLSASADGYCKKVRRRHQIINWCEYTADAALINLPRQSNAVDTIAYAYLAYSDGDNIYQNTPFGASAIDISSGYYQYDQYIYIDDQEQPNLTASPIEMVCIEDVDECFGYVDYQFEITDNCDEPVMVTHKFQNNGSIPATDEYGILAQLPNGHFQITGNYPPGQNNFIIILEDDCGNVKNYDRSFLVQDCAAPVLTCSDSVVLHLPLSGSLPITTEHALGSVSDNCQLQSLSLSQDSLLTTIDLTCDHVGDNTFILWAKDMAGNESQCQFFVELRDTNTMCEQYYTIEGYVQTAAGEGIPNTLVTLDADNVYTQMTDENGYYRFEDILQGEGYTVTPSKTENFTNGVSTFDVVLIRKHVLSLSPFDTAQEFIAGDVNNSASISTFDAVLAQKMVLSLTDSVAQNTSWRFLDPTYVFQDPQNPLGEDYPEYITIHTLDGDQQHNIIGIKVADPNMSATLE